ncbi:MAG: hypothetical protein HC835_13525 [Oscillatoriales cyanobacterium RM2_1_1]|nr:hypothetical protein [Oscillatoriales cyanobacterium SM2_3_0]NJO46563.1 hypothetical protein [Oscillatoriales cyanobacterium RM2_1_1]
MTQDLDPTQELAQKNTWTTGVLTFLIPLFGYIYTKRYKALLTTFGVFLGLTTLCYLSEPSLEEDEDFIAGMMFLYSVGATVENTRAIGQAKKRVISQAPMVPLLNPDRAKIQLLRLAKAQGEMTLAECVLETDCSPAEIRQWLEELQREDLIQIDNRERDGAIVYRII